MPQRGILLLTCILTIHLIPVIITILTAVPARCRFRRLSVFLLTAASLVLNGAGYVLAHLILFHHVRIKETAYRVGMILFTWEDLPAFPMMLGLCTFFALIFGYLLRLGFGPGGFRGVWKPRKPLVLLSLSGILLILILWVPVSVSARRKLVINELCSTNATLLPDENMQVWDYVELYNSGYISYPVIGLYLSDDQDELKKYRIEDMILAPRTHLLIFLDDRSSFRISDKGETVWLSDEDGTVLDQVFCPPLTVDTGYCRVPDGGSVFEVRTGSPGGDNQASSLVLSAPVFSRPGGFYEEGFELFLFSENNARIYYTLDGSTPSPDSLLYEGPVPISDASTNPNVWSMREDVSSGFLTGEILNTEYDPPGYRAPDKPIDKCTVIRALCMDEYGHTSPVSSASYFVGFDAKKGYDGMNILSVITDPDNLFDPEKGIYVLGNIYDLFASSEKNVWYAPFWWWWDANYRQRGKMWERPVCLQFFDQHRQPVLTKNGGMRIQGGGSRGYLPRSFNFYSRKEYDGEKRLKAPLFDNSYEPKRVTLFAGGDDYLVKLNDYLMASLIPDRNFSTMKFEPYSMFLNGEYWGVYWLTEKYDEEYFEYYYDVRGDNVVMIKNGGVSLGMAEDIDLYSRLRSFVLNNDMSLDENYQTACTLMDMDSYIDYYAAEIYISRTDDWPGGNYALWRTRDVEEGTFSDGRWRWILFDVNSGGMTSSRSFDDTLTMTRSADPLFDSLIKNHQFYDQFVSTILDMAQTEFDPDRISDFIDHFQDFMKDPIEKEYLRFYGSDQNVLAEFYRQTEDVRTFFNERYGYITSYFDCSLKNGSTWEPKTERNRSVP